MENFDQVVETNAVNATDLASRFFAMEDDRDDVVALPIGINYDGKLIRLVTIKEPDGFTEEKQTDPNYRKFFSTIISATLADCIVEIAGVDLPEHPKKAFEYKYNLVQQLAESDRQYLLLRIYRLQHGNVYKSKAQCKHCGHVNEIERDLQKDLKIVFVPDELNQQQSDRLIVRNVQLDVPLPIDGQKFDTIDIRLPSGETALAIEKASKTNLSLATTRMLLSLLGVNGDKFIISEDKLKRLSTRVRQATIEAVAKHRVGFINEIEHVCENDECGETFTAPYQVTEFLGK
jgi:hypothetical protein